jgi:AcrR family transcriptional regulator
MKVAEELFALHGVDAVSTREIVKAAGANTSAIHYHFGSKDGLIEELMEARLNQLGSYIRQRATELAADGAPTPRHIATAIVMPLADLAQSQGSASLRFMIGVGLGSRSAYFDLWFKLAEEAFVDYQRYVGPVSGAASHLEPYQMEWWFKLSRVLAYIVLGYWDAQPSPTRRNRTKASAAAAQATPDSDLVNILIDFLTAAFSAPAS